MNEVVDKYGVCWVAAAGNHGPALNTIGTPPDISTENIIGKDIYIFYNVKCYKVFPLY